MQKIREHLALLLIGLLPFHAFLVTVLTKWLRGADQPPWNVLAVWKEVLLAAVMGVALLEILAFWRDEERRRKVLHFDLLDLLAAAIFVLAAAVTWLEFEGWRQVAYGVKYDIVPLAAWFVLRRVPWSEQFLPKAFRVLFGVGVAVALWALVSVRFPMEAFRWLGYSDLHSLYNPGGPLAAFQQIGEMGVRRLQGTFSGPNQFGLWLLLPFSIGMLFCLRDYRLWNKNRFFWNCLGLVLLASAILGTFSRSAWLAAMGILLLASLKSVDRTRLQRSFIRLLAPFLFFITLLALLAPNILLRSQSTRDHLLKPLAGLQAMAQQPLGYGLGTAGPASNRTSDTCVFLPDDADPSWAADRSDLCVFVGNTQVLPAERACNCPFVTENWYIQLGVELGVLGFAVFIALTFLVLLRLWQGTTEADLILLLAFFGISVAGLVLHSWEEPAIAYTLWVLLAAKFSKH